MLLPSGRTLDADDRAVLGVMHDFGFLRYSETPFTLKSKIQSNVYVYGREDFTDNPDLEYRLGMHMARLVYKHSSDERQQILIGLPPAGTALAQAAAFGSLNVRLHKDPTRKPIGHRIMREVTKKDHGVHGGWVNGKPDLEKHRYWIVDNVATDGATKIEAISKLNDDGYPALEMPVLICVDRQQGAVERLKKAGFKEVYVLFHLLDITHVFGELGWWPKEAVAAVEKEILEHQFVA